jgi:hypothetical protein
MNDDSLLFHHYAFNLLVGIVCHILVWQLNKIPSFAFRASVPSDYQLHKNVTPKHHNLRSERKDKKTFCASFRSPQKKERFIYADTHNSNSISLAAWVIFIILRFYICFQQTFICEKEDIRRVKEVILCSSKIIEKKRDIFFHQSSIREGEGRCLRLSITATNRLVLDCTWAIFERRSFNTTHNMVEIFQWVRLLNGERLAASRLFEVGCLPSSFDDDTTQTNENNNDVIIIII